VCCGTKRLTEIQCPSDCPYLASAREHPPAATLRRQQQDFSMVAQMMRDLNRRQSELLFMILMFLNRHQPLELQPIIDDDVADTARALAATFETASRGLIYEHRPASRPAERLIMELKPLLAKAGEGGGSSFERDAAVVFRRLEEGVRDRHGEHPTDRRAFLDLLERVLAHAPADADAAPANEPSRLIVP
jgi:hypothetical protein